MNQLLEAAKENVGFLLICVLIVASVILIAYVAEVLIAKKRGTVRVKKETRTRRLIVIAMLSAVAVVLMTFEIPLWFLPSFYQIDLSELPVIIGGFTLGPVAGILIEFIKILLHLFIKGTGTAFVGELANFLVGCAFVVPASIFYYAKKSRKSAIIGLVFGTVVMVVSGCFLNAFVLLPKYAEAFHMPIDALIAMGTEVNGGISNLFTFVAFAVAPFNFIKCFIVSLVTLLIYKKISPILKGHVM